METRRNFLIKLAEEKGFDPFVASNWNSVTRADFDALKVKLWRSSASCPLLFLTDA